MGKSAVSQGVYDALKQAKKLPWLINQDKVEWAIFDDCAMNFYKIQKTMDGLFWEIMRQILQGLKAPDVLILEVTSKHILHKVKSFASYMVYIEPDVVHGQTHVYNVHRRGGDLPAPTFDFWEEVNSTTVPREILKASEPLEDKINRVTFDVLEMLG